MKPVEELTMAELAAKDKPPDPMSGCEAVEDATMEALLADKPESSHTTGSEGKPSRSI